LASGGYSFDPEVRFINQKDVMIGFAGGATQYFRRQNSERNYANYSTEGFYLKPQIGYMFYNDLSNLTFFLNVAFVYSQAKERLQPFIPGTYFGNYYGPEIRRNNLRSYGGEVSFEMMYNFKSRFSLMLNARLTAVSYPQVPDNQMVNQLAVQYMPGVGNWLGNWNNEGIYYGSNMFFSIGLGIKAVYRIFSK
jgi:hypothetical protein